MPRWVMMFWKCLDALHCRNCFILSCSESEKMEKKSNSVVCFCSEGNGTFCDVSWYQRGKNWSLYTLNSSLPSPTQSSPSTKKISHLMLTKNWFPHCSRTIKPVWRNCTADYPFLINQNHCRDGGGCGGWRAGWRGACQGDCQTLLWLTFNSISPLWLIFPS